MTNGEIGPQETQTSLPLPDTPEAAMEVWREKVRGLPQLDQREISEKIGDVFGIRIPAEPLNYVGYIRLISKLQSIRAELVEIEALVNWHKKTRMEAIKSLQGTLKKLSTLKSVSDREADAEAWLIYIRRSSVDVDRLCDDVRAAIDMVNRTMADVVQQMKAVSAIGIPTGMLDTSICEDLPPNWGDDALGMGEDDAEDDTDNMNNTEEA